MPLGVVLTASTGPTAYALQAEVFTINYQRGPIQAPLPGGVDPILIDLGQFRPTIQIRGTIRSTALPSTDGTNTISSQQQLEDFVTDRYAQTITIALTTPVEGASNVTNTYTCKISGVNFELAAGQNDLWRFQLSLATLGRT